MKRRFRNLFSLTLCSLTIMCMGGNCDIDLDDLLDSLEDLEITIVNTVNEVQVVDTTAPGTTLPGGFNDTGDTIIIAENATVITDPSTQLVIEELPDITLLGIENITGFDIFIQYLVDGELQGVLVFDGETLLIEYPCLVDIELVSEDDFDPFTGDLVDSFDLTGIFFENPLDFECGDALIITVDPIEIQASVELIDLI